MILTVRVTAELEVPESQFPVPVRTGLEPADTSSQRVLTVETKSATALIPATQLLASDGKRTALLQLAPGPAVIEAVAEVELDRPARKRNTPIPWEQSAGIIRAIRSTGRTGDGTPVPVQEALVIAATAMPSPGAPIDDSVRDLAFSNVSPGEPLIVGIAQIAAQIAKADLPPETAAHRLIGAMRSLGLAAAYATGVSPGRGLRTWVSIYIPGHSWFEIDPCTATPIEDDVVTLQWGRDGHDVPFVRWPGGGEARVTATATVKER